MAQRATSGRQGDSGDGLLVRHRPRPWRAARRWRQRRRRRPSERPADRGAPPPIATASCRTDVTREDEVAAVVADAVARFGRLDGVVNAAGIAGGGPVHLLDADAGWDRVIDVNLKGTFLVAKHVIQQMLEQEPVDGERGSIVTLASVEGLEGTAGGSAYNASKGGVVLLTRNLAIDYGRQGIRANALCPGSSRRRCDGRVRHAGHGGGRASTSARSTSCAASASPRRSRRSRRSCSRRTRRSSRARPSPVDGGYTAGPRPRRHGADGAVGGYCT